MKKPALAEHLPTLAVTVPAFAKHLPDAAVKEAEAAKEGGYREKDGF
jgi:hypothetical protein